MKDSCSVLHWTLHTPTDLNFLIFLWHMLDSSIQNATAFCVLCNYTNVSKVVIINFRLLLWGQKAFCWNNHCLCITFFLPFRVFVLYFEFICASYSSDFFVLFWCLQVVGFSLLENHGEYCLYNVFLGKWWMESWYKKICNILMYVFTSVHEDYFIVCNEIWKKKRRKKERYYMCFLLLCKVTCAFIDWTSTNWYWLDCLSSIPYCCSPLNKQPVHFTHTYM